jgi:DNA-binding transcriptional regulator YdaS (Cro superfamily)
METIIDKKPLSEAVEKAGGQVALAKQLTEMTGIPVSQQRVWNWLYRDDEAPPEKFCVPIERLTGVLRNQLRPDVDWGDLPNPAPTEATS